MKIQDGLKKYGEKIVLEDINLIFESGHFYGLSGINGSGKTLVLKVLAGYISLTKGTVYQNNIRIRHKNNFIENAGIIIETPQFISNYTLIQNLNLIKNMCINSTNINLNKWLDMYRIKEFVNTKYKNLSLGTKQKMILIQALMDKPSILLLDEPFNSLDSASVDITKQYLFDIHKKSLVIITSHIHEDLNTLCDKIYQMEDGMLIRQNSISY